MFSNKFDKQLKKLSVLIFLEQPPFHVLIIQMNLVRQLL